MLPAGSVAVTTKLCAPAGSVPVTAPFTATVWQVPGTVGDAVTEEDVICSIEAMKMETRVSSPVSGRLVEVYVRPGEQVAPGQVLAAVAP